jgi:hypothetical protein
LKSICAYKRSTNDVNTVGYQDPCVVYDCTWNDLRKEKTTLENRVILMPVSRQ